MLFKYLPYERIDVIVNQRIRFTQPSSLNDPFEEFKLVSANAAKSNLIKWFEKKAKKFELRHPEMTPDERAQFSQLKRDLLLKMDTTLSPLSIGKEVMKLVNPSIGVLSLSRTNTSSLMWSHYASAYSGYVIGFDEQNPFFSLPTVGGEPSSPREVRYSSERVIVDAESADYYERLLCQKPAEWSYEEEVRCFRAFMGFEHAAGSDSQGNTVFLSDFPAEMISALYVGHRASPETREALESFVTANHQTCSFFEAMPSRDHYGVEIHDFSGR